MRSLALLLLMPPLFAQTGDSGAAAEVLRQYCAGCHNVKLKTAGVTLDPAGVTQIAGNTELWERVARQLRAKTMPPPNVPRPDAVAYSKTAAYLEAELDRAAAANPEAGSLPNLRRLTRTEYKNAIRDLLALDGLPKEMDFSLLLPADNAASGFDNIADLLYVSPATMERYLDAARKIARLAVGDSSGPVLVNYYRLPQQAPQDSRVEDLPPGTRGGIAIQSYFPLDAEYEFQIELSGFPRESHQLEVTVDGERTQLIPIEGPGRRVGPVQAKFAVKAGPREIGIAFIQHTEALDEGSLHTRLRTRGTQPAIGAVTIRGPYNATGPGETPARERIFSCKPKTSAEDAACARQILAALARRAYRRPVNDRDLHALIPFYEEGRKISFELGIQNALERLLVSPQFLYRIERDPPDAKPGSTYRLNDLELASRLSFFLWSSIPDDLLLELAAAGQLHEPQILEQQVRRMLADRRSDAMVNNFAEQWLYLRDVEVKAPDVFLFQNFDEGLRKSFERETELFVGSVLRENRSVKDLLTANYTFLNERLAKHYGIPQVRGSDFRRVALPEGSPRAGLLGKGGILTLTSYSIRTSPVLRGKYVLENLLASPPPPPPPDVPSLKTEAAGSGETLSLREAMTRHRASPACASCHARMDPIGFALESFNAVGQWRDQENGMPLDLYSKMPDGTELNGVQGVREFLLRDPERFVGAVTQKLLMYALGRNVQYFDQPAVRKIVRDAAGSDYQFAALVLGVARSDPFQQRSAKGGKQTP